MGIVDYVGLAICINGPFVLYFLGRWFLNKTMPLDPLAVVHVPHHISRRVLTVISYQLSPTQQAKSSPVSGAGSPDAGTGGETG